MWTGHLSDNLSLFLFLSMEFSARNRVHSSLCSHDNVSDQTGSGFAQDTDPNQPFLVLLYIIIWWKKLSIATCIWCVCMHVKPKTFSSSKHQRNPSLIKCMFHVLYKSNIIFSICGIMVISTENNKQLYLDQSFCFDIKTDYMITYGLYCI